VHTHKENTVPLLKICKAYNGLNTRLKTEEQETQKEQDGNTPVTQLDGFNCV